MADVDVIIDYVRVSSPTYTVRDGGMKSDRETEVPLTVTRPDLGRVELIQEIALKRKSNSF